MKIVFHDVDGCLNAEVGTAVPIQGEPMLSPQSDKLRTLGNSIDRSAIDHLVINTGRSLDDTLPLVKAIGSKKLRYIVAEHGAIYHDMLTDRLIDPGGLITLKLDPIKQFISWYNTTGYQIMNQRVGEMPILAKSANLTLDARNDLDARVVFDTLQEIAKAEAPVNFNELVFHFSEADGYVDALGKVDKGDGIKVIKSILADNEPSEKSQIVFAVGNGLNDMPMLEMASVPICPANSEPEVKAYCRSRSGFVSRHQCIDATLDWLYLDH